MKVFSHFENIRILGKSTSLIIWYWNFQEILQIEENTPLVKKCPVQIQQAGGTVSLLFWHAFTKESSSIVTTLLEH